jgi:hypothetical protein
MPFGEVEKLDGWRVKMDIKAALGKVSAPNVTTVARVVNQALTHRNAIQYRVFGHVMVSSVHNALRFWPAILRCTYGRPQHSFSAASSIAIHHVSPRFRNL